jgi:hypothetical protein
MVKTQMHPTESQLKDFSSLSTPGCSIWLMNHNLKLLLKFSSTLAGEVALRQMNMHALQKIYECQQLKLYLS